MNCVCTVLQCWRVACERESGFGMCEWAPTVGVMMVIDSSICCFCLCRSSQTRWGSMRSMRLDRLARLVRRRGGFGSGRGKGPFRPVAAAAAAAAAVAAAAAAAAAGPAIIPSAS